MPRDDLLIGRFSEPWRVYHVTTVTEGRVCHFTDFHRARLVVAEMRFCHDSEMVRSLAWVLMPDHLHWVFQLGESFTLSDAMKSFKARSSKAVNAYSGVSGRFWQRGFYDHALRKDEDLKKICRYMIANPLRKNLVEHIGEYPLWDAIWL
jgi:REP element-mobilizing transposase RayT